MTEVVRKCLAQARRTRTMSRVEAESKPLEICNVWVTDI